MPLMEVTNLLSLPPEWRVRIQQWYLEQRSYKDMSTRLKEGGFHVNPTRLYHYCKNNLLGETTKERPLNMTDEERVNLERSTITMCLDICTEMVIKFVADPDLLPKLTTINDFERLVTAASKLITASVNRDKVEIEKKAVVARVRGELIAEIRSLLAGKPEVVRELCDVVEVASDKFLQ